MLKYITDKYKAYKEKQELNRCTECGKTFNRLEWGGRCHYTNSGGWYIHPIDYIMTMDCKTFEESREQIARLEKTDRILRQVKVDMGDKFCRDHYKGCPK